MGGRIEFDQSARAIGGGVMTRSNSRCDHRLKSTPSNFGSFFLYVLKEWSSCCTWAGF